MSSTWQVWHCLLPGTVISTHCTLGRSLAIAAVHERIACTHTARKLVLLVELGWQACEGIILLRVNVRVHYTPGQSILEGLNAMLDHRAEVFIPELGQTFQCPPTFRLFAAQNPLQQGGGRRGLPRSFLNRFTRVLVEPMQAGDLAFISGEMPLLCCHTGCPGNWLLPCCSTGLKQLHCMLRL